MPNIRQDEKYAQMYDEYQKGFSLQQVGHMFNISRQAVFTGFKRRKYELRKKQYLPYQFFDGEKFTLGNHGYYRRTTGDRELMHRVVWMHHNGEIPESVCVHHLDRDRANNKIENLELIGRDEHSSKYNTGRNQYSEHRGED